MNLNTFEQSQQEKITSNGALNQSDAYSAQPELDRIKQKIENRKIKQKRLKIIFGTFTVIIVLLLAIVGYSQYRLYTLSQEEVTATSTTQVAAKTGEEVVKALSRHILVPPGTPQIAEVKDVDRLRDSQAFFKDAENGDIVVVYGTAIILYRPSLDIVIAMGDISGVGQVKP